MILTSSDNLALPKQILIPSQLKYFEKLPRYKFFNNFRALILKLNSDFFTIFEGNFFCLLLLTHTLVPRTIRNSFWFRITKNYVVHKKGFADKSR